jgi:hypothetical protein
MKKQENPTKQDEEEGDPRNNPWGKLLFVKPSIIISVKKLGQGIACK